MDVLYAGHAIIIVPSVPLKLDVISNRPKRQKLPSVPPGLNDGIAINNVISYLFTTDEHHRYRLRIGQQISYITQVSIFTEGQYRKTIKVVLLGKILSRSHPNTLLIREHGNERADRWQMSQKITSLTNEHKCYFVIFTTFA